MAGPEGRATSPGQYPAPPREVLDALLSLQEEPKDTRQP
jgi:hypothetical protein